EQVSRTPEEDVFDLILSDLNDAISLLPDPSDIESGRASRAAAQALLSKVYVHLEDWNNAKLSLENVINNYNYNLVGNFGDLFSLETENNSEAIFSVTFVEGTNGHVLSSIFAPLQGIYGIVPNGQRIGRPAWSLRKLFDDDDSRKAVSTEEWQLRANDQPDDDPIWYPDVNKHIVPHARNAPGLDIPRL